MNTPEQDEIVAILAEVKPIMQKIVKSLCPVDPGRLISEEERNKVQVRLERLNQLIQKLHTGP